MSEDLTVSTLVKTVSPTNSCMGRRVRHLQDMNILQQFPSLRAKKFFYPLDNSWDVILKLRVVNRYIDGTIKRNVITKHRNPAIGQDTRCNFINI